MKQPDGHLWNLVIFNDAERHCYLEGSFVDFKKAHKRGQEVCKGISRYKVMSEMEYIQFRNPYYKE